MVAVPLALSACAQGADTPSALEMDPATRGYVTKAAAAGLDSWGEFMKAEKAEQPERVAPAADAPGAAGAPDSWEEFMKAEKAEQPEGVAPADLHTPARKVKGDTREAL